MRRLNRTTIRRTLIALVAWSVGFFGVIAQSGICRSAEQTVWRKGTDFRRQLDQRIGVAWSSNPLRDTLDNLSHNQHLAILIDRRVDPGASVNFSAVDTPLKSVLTDLAKHMQLGVCFFDSIVYLGPKEMAIRLPTLMAVKKEESRKLPNDVRLRLARQRATSWETLSTPRDILKRLAEETPLRIENLELIPHDLWPAKELPPLPLVERLTLLLAGFELTFEWSVDGSSVRLIPISQLNVVSRTYYPQGKAIKAVEELSKHFPDAKIQRDGNKIVVTAGFVVHEAIRRLFETKPSRSSTGATTLNKMRIDKLKFENQQVGGVMKSLAQRLRLELFYDPQLTTTLQKRISLNLKNKSYKEVFQAVLGPVGLTFTLEGNRLEIVELNE